MHWASNFSWTMFFSLARSLLWGYAIFMVYALHTRVGLTEISLYTRDWWCYKLSRVRHYNWNQEKLVLLSQPYVLIKGSQKDLRLAPFFFPLHWYVALCTHYISVLHHAPQDHIITSWPSDFDLINHFCILFILADTWIVDGMIWYHHSLICPFCQK